VRQQNNAQQIDPAHSAKGARLAPTACAPLAYRIDNATAQAIGRRSAEDSKPCSSGQAFESDPSNRQLESLTTREVSRMKQVLGVVAVLVAATVASSQDGDTEDLKQNEGTVGVMHEMDARSDKEGKKVDVNSSSMTASTPSTLAAWSPGGETVNLTRRRSPKSRRNRTEAPGRGYDHEGHHELKGDRLACGSPSRARNGRRSSAPRKGPADCCSLQATKP